jgi:hypothetical protein
MGISFLVNGAKIINVFIMVIKLQPFLKHYTVSTEKRKTTDQPRM